MFEPRLGVLDELPPDAGYDLPDELLGAVDRFGHRIRASLGWTRAIAAEQDALDDAMSGTPGARYTAVGFFDPDREPEDPGTFPGFGVVVYTDDPEVRRDGRLRPVTARGIPFTVLPRPGRFRPDTMAGITQQQAGRLACWATSRRGQRQGWLTAKHCAAALGQVVDSAPDCTDAALVSTGTTGTGSRIRAFAGLTAGVVVDMRLGSGPCIATVLDVSTDFGMLKSGKFPLRFSTDRAGLPGDSGSLLAEQASTAPLGIYLGSFTPAVNPGGAPAGIGLSIYQLEHMMDLEVYL